MNPLHATQALELQVPLEPVPAEQVIDGTPRTGVVEGEKTAHYEWGVWEMTPRVDVGCRGRRNIRRDRGTRLRHPHCQWS